MKIAVTILLIGWVGSKIPWESVIELLRDASVSWLIFAVAAFVLSQWVSANRLRSFLKALHFTISTRENNILYVKGMFYNFFIPGGIGGDAYKVYYLKSTKQWSATQVTKAIFNDRLSGLIAIIVWLQLLLLTFFSTPIWSLLLLVGSIVTVFMSKKIFDKLVPSFTHVFYVNLALSLLVQMLQLLCVYGIIASFSTASGTFYYLAVFLISSVLSVVSFAGIGVREWLFYQAALLFEFDSTLAVSIGLLFSIITALVSFIGFFFPLEKTDK